MPGGEDGRQRDIEQLRRALRARRARLEPGPPASRPGQAPVGTGPVQRQFGPRLELDRPAPPPPATAAAPAAARQPLLPPAPPMPARRTRRARRLIAPAVALAVGLAFGLALGAGRAGGPAGAPAAPPPASAPAAPPVTSVVVRPTASSACLETARRADEVIHLLVTNRRSRAARVLVAYTIASRQCRRDASP
jgi:hypothetical protein